ncbi:hypothetical protein AWW67_07815 [Roseivirga seohaensis]|uniref:Endonuclease/exonuclease/phosphatase domain-containing protein n=1 Tax=Roseivirga seohaensis TaxID=1914963 RepID=A0A150XRB3_9BACT|nr:hypothetical protein [Roseivirga seohaensis]KYG81253.1 hypothetical protein AWW67_07815 [Roseivirga seohaensis]
MINQSCFRYYGQKINAVLCGYFLLISVHVYGQKAYLASESFDPSPRNEDRVRLAFYNVENLFDYFDDSLTIDEQFLPRGDHYWTKSRYTEKQNKLAKTILAMGGWDAPELIGFCEIENRYVLESLTQFTQLKSLGYEIIHKDSRDARGIDVAAIYRPDKLKLLNYEYYQLNFPFDIASRTRDILHTVMELPNKDTLHFFVNHWPSKFGGEFETQPKRMFAAQFVRTKADSLLKLNPNAHIVITGDFNDEPDEESMLNGLAVNTDINTLKPTDLYNLMYELRFVAGTHSFENKWGILDQFVVSGNLLLKQSRTRVRDRTAQIFDMDFLIMEGATGARRPFRTYQGPKYIGGYSDHLPIILDLILAY